MRRANSTRRPMQIFRSARRSVNTCSSRFIPYAAAAATVLLWAGSFLAIRDGVEVMAPLPLAAARFMVAGLISLAYLLVAATKRPERRDLPRIVLCGLIGVALYNGLLGAGERRVSASIASFIVAIQPLFAGLGSWLLNGERLGWRLPTGGLIAIVGVAVITSAGTISGAMSAVLMTIGAAACSGLYFVIQRPLVIKLGPISAAASTMLAGGLMLIPWSMEGLFVMATSQTALRAILYLALAASVGGYALWMVALKSLGATRSAMFLFLMAPLTGVMEAIGRGVRPSTSLILGGALTILGVTLASAKPPLFTVVTQSNECRTTD